MFVRWWRAGLKWSELDVLNPSAENIARHIYEQTALQMRATANGAAISSITVWESDVTAATYRA